jgi:hypothetical protein
VSVTHRPAQASGSLALAVTAGVALALGAATNLLPEAGAGVAAAALLTVGTLQLDRANNGVRAAGGVAVAAGALAAVGAVLAGAEASFAYAALGVGLPLSVVAMAVGVVVAPDPPTLATGRSVLWYGLVLTVAGTLAASAIHTSSVTMPLTLAGDLLGVLTDLATRNDLAGLATLGLLAGALASLAGRTYRALPERHRRDDPLEGTAATARRGLVLLARTGTVVGALAVPPALIADAGATPLADALGPAGAPLVALSTARPLHALAAVAAVALAVALAAIGVYRRVDRTTPDDVGDRLARAAGGIFLLVAVPVASTVLTPLGLLEPRVPPAAVDELASLVAQYGTGTVLYLLVVVALVLALVLTVALGVVLTADAVPEGAGAVGLGAALLFAATLGAAAADVGPLLTLVAGAAALFVWDVGENGVEVGRQLGREAETSRGEFVHSGASALVAGGAVAVAFGAGTTASAVTVSGVGWVLVLALTCSTLAGVLFLVALRS